VDDDEVSLGYDYSGLILERGRGALDQVEETVTSVFINLHSPADIH